MEYGEARGRPAAEPSGMPGPAAAAAPTALAAAASAASAEPPPSAEPPSRPSTDAAAPPVREGARPRPAVDASTGLSAARPVAAPSRRRWPLVAALVLAVFVIAGTGAAVGYVLLPTATVTVRLESEPVGPITFAGTADPDAVAVDAATATIPADRITLPLSATGTFPATGKRVEEAPATGSVEWQNCDPSRSYTIPAGTVARTGSGVGFATQDGILVPVAILSGTPPNLRVKCQVRSVDVVAVRAGPAGNVAAGAIRIVPGAYDPGLVLVTNPAATSGGVREEFPKVVAKDVAAAVAALTVQLDEQLASGASSPPGMAAGATAYPETARRDEPVPSEPVADIVGREAESFDLTLTATGSVVAADPTPLEAIAAARIVAEVPEGMQVREGSIRVEIGPGVVEGETIRYPVVARAEAVRDVTVDEIRGLVRGKTPAEAREILAEYGSVEIVVWPDWVSTITTIDGRLVITVEGVPPAEPASATPPPPSQSASPPPSPSPSPSPSS
jgi:hypothetical protein